MRAETRTLARARLLARGPRIAVFAMTGLLALAGLRAAVVPPATAVPRAHAPVREPAGLVAFAEAFAREYLSWDDDLAAREARLSAYLAEGLDPDAGALPGTGTRQRVAWTAASAPQAAARGTWSVAVVAGLAGGARATLDVPVRAAGGALAVIDYPALAALSPAPDARALEYGDPVEDSELAGVVERALRNFLAGRPGDLQADLAPGARVTTPDQTARLLSVDELAWEPPGRGVAALVAAELPDRTRLRLRFHLFVKRDGRWFVAAISPTTQTTQGATP